MLVNGVGIGGAKGSDDELGRLCKELVESTLKKGDISGAQRLVQGVYGKKLGGHNGKPPKTQPKPPVQDRLAGGGGSGK